MYTYESFVFGYFFSLMGKAAGKKIVTGRPRAYMSKAELAELKCVCTAVRVLFLFGLFFGVLACIRRLNMEEEDVEKSPKRRKIEMCAVVA
jgi:hypothetical protein